MNGDKIHRDGLRSHDTARTDGVPVHPPVAVGSNELRLHTRALERLFESTRAELGTYFARRLGNAEIAEEHVQEIFLRFAKSGYRADGPDARAIVFGMARNLLTDTLRQRRRHQLSGFDESQRLESASLNEIASANATPEEAMSAHQELQQVLAVLQNLPEKCRRVFVMHRLQGRSHKEIAQELNITVSTVEKHIMEAAMRLLKAVATDQPEGL